MANSVADSQKLRAVERELQGHGMMMGQHGMIIMNLIHNRRDIRRTVDQGEDGVVHTKTWSDRVQVTNWIQQHVAQMLQRVENNQLIRPWDPLFVALFENKDEILTNATNTVNGVSVELEGITYCGRSLAETHAQVVSAFIELGHAEVSQAHAVPAICSTPQGDLEIPKVEIEEIEGVSDSTAGEESGGDPEAPSEEETGGDPETPSEEETGGGLNTIAGKETGGDSETTPDEEFGGDPETTSGNETEGDTETISGEESEGNSETGLGKDDAGELETAPEEGDGLDKSLPEGDGDDSNRTPGGDKDNMNSLKEDLDSAKSLIPLGFPLFLFAFAMLL